MPCEPAGPLMFIGAGTSPPSPLDLVQLSSPVSEIAGVKVYPG